MCSRSHLLCIGPANPLIAGDLRGPVAGAAGTRYFEPDGVAFLTIGLPPEPLCVSGDPLPVALSDRSAPALHLCLWIESRAATIAAVSLVSAAVSSCTWAAVYSCRPCKRRRMAFSFV